MTKKQTLIVGGTKGIGLAYALKRAARGEVVFVTGRDASLLPVSNDNIKYISCDLANNSSMMSLLDLIQNISVNMDSIIFCQRYRGDNAWIGEWQISIEATRRIVECYVSCIEHKQVSPRSIVVLGSSATRLDAAEQTVAYHAVRAALEQMVRCWAVRFGVLGLRVNMLSPALIKKHTDSNPCTLMQSLIPAGYVCSPEEITSVLDFLCSADSSYITGQNIFVDGGISLRTQFSTAQIVKKTLAQ